MPRACASVSRTVSSVRTTRLPLSSIRASNAPMSPAGQSRAISSVRAVVASGLARITRIISSMLATAMAKPTKRCARSRARPRSNRLRRRITSSRNRDERGQQLLQPHQPRPADIQRQHVGAELGLHLGEPVEVVQHHLGRRIPLQFDHDAHAVAVALVPQIADALDLLGAHQFGDALDQRVLVHLIRDFPHDDRRAVACGSPRFRRGRATECHRAQFRKLSGCRSGRG